MILICECPICGKVTEVEVEPSAYFRYRNGVLAQNAFPNLSATERECIISGTCPTCQDTLFGEE